MSEHLDTLTTTLKQHGHSITDARKTVFLALLDKEPQSISELTKATAHSLNRASLYRVVELFEQLGIVQRLQIGWKYKLELSDSFAAHHHHMSCIKCERVEPFEETSIIEFELKQLAEERGFKQTGHQLEVRGLCKECQAAA